MKYKKIETTILEITNTGIIVTDNEVNFTGFPAEIGNPYYDAFLEQAQLTDKQVHALKPDVWYDFPEGDN